jgi:hypothetical protein
MHNVNAKSDAFGNGIFDGYSIVTGHEYSEAVTDPDNVTSVQDGWNDDQTSENADKCAWIETQNITLGGHAYAVQPTWSNEAFDAGGDGCAVSRRPSSVIREGSGSPGSLSRLSCLEPAAVSAGFVAAAAEEHRAPARRAVARVVVEDPAAVPAGLEP